MAVVVLRSSLMSSDEHLHINNEAVGYLPSPWADSETRRSPSRTGRANRKRSTGSAERGISQTYTSTFDLVSSLYRPVCSSFLLCCSRECCRDMVECAGFYSGVWKGKTQYFHFLVVFRRMPIAYYTTYTIWSAINNKNTFKSNTFST